MYKMYKTCFFTIFLIIATYSFVQNIKISDKLLIKNLLNNRQIYNSSDTLDIKNNILYGTPRGLSGCASRE